MSSIATGRYDDAGPPTELSTLVGAQAGVVSRGQLLELGLTDSTVKAHLKAGRWQRVHTGVFATFTGDLSELAAIWAGLLVAAPDAVVSHATALRLFGMRGLPDDGRIHVSVSHQRQIGAKPGLVVHRRCRLAAVVHPSRQPPSVRLEDAVLHVAAAPDQDGRQAGRIAVIADACQQRLTNVTRLRAALDLLPVLPGRRTLAGVLDDVAVGAHSYLELSYLRRVEKAHGLPRMERQAAASVGGRRIWRDGWYPEFGVAHELDGRLGHEWSTDRRQDRLRDLTAAGEGLITVRHGYADVVDEPCLTAHLVAAVLQARGWTGRPRRCGKACRLPGLG